MTVTVTWHTAKYGDPYLEFVLCIYPSKVHTYSNEHTHTVNTHPEQCIAVGSHLCCGARGAVGGSVPCSRHWGWRERCTFTPSHLQSLPARDSNSQPLDYESDSLTIRPRLPPKKAERQNRPLVPWQPMLITLILLSKRMRAEQLSINLPIGKTHNAI